MWSQQSHCCRCSRLEGSCCPSGRRPVLRNVPAVEPELLVALWPQLQGGSPGVGPLPEGGERWLICMGCRTLRSTASVERRSWMVAGRCQWASVTVHGEWAEVLWGGLYWWLCLRAMPCRPCLKGTENSVRFFSSSCGWFGQVWREEIHSSAGASSGSPSCQGVAFDLAAVRTKVFAKGLKIKKKKEKKPGSKNMVRWTNTHALL